MAFASCRMCNWQSMPGAEDFNGQFVKHVRRNHPCSLDGCVEPGLLMAEVLLDESGAPDPAAPGEPTLVPFCQEAHAEMWVLRRLKEGQEQCA